MALLHVHSHILSPSGDPLFGNNNHFCAAEGNIAHPCGPSETEENGINQMKTAWMTHTATF